jgi:hypothetical protein
MTEVKWRRNDEERRWDLICRDAVQGMIYGDPWRLAGFVTDEMLTRTPMTREQLDQMILRRFRIPLPPEAHEGEY